MNIYTRKDIMDIKHKLDIKPGQHYVVTLDNDEAGDSETYFDGFANVYDCTITVWRGGTKYDGYTGTITHEMYCYYTYGDVS